jgi:hypothetical protein
MCSPRKPYQSDYPNLLLAGSPEHFPGVCTPAQLARRSASAWQKHRPMCQLYDARTGPWAVARDWYEAKWPPNSSWVAKS